MKENIKKEFESYIEELSEGYEQSTKVINNLIDLVLEYLPEETIIDCGIEPFCNCIENALGEKNEIKDYIEEAKKHHDKIDYNSYNLTNDYVINLALFATYGDQVSPYLNPIFLRMIGKNKEEELDKYFEENYKIDNKGAQVLVKLQYDGNFERDYE